MNLSKTLAGALAVNRAGFGLGYLARPVQARPTWIGRAARKPGTQVVIRAQGARDVALGAGALQALARDDTAQWRAWVASHVACDLTDLVVTYAAREHLPKRRARLAMGVAAASAAVGAAALATSAAAKDSGSRVSPQR